jgi:hypothetical protein
MLRSEIEQRDAAMSKIGTNPVREEYTVICDF